MPKVTEEYRAAKRNEITKAAMRAFHRKGFRAASMADIISESGLSAGAIYGHFKSKDEIVLAVASEVVGARTGEIDELAARTPMPPPAAVIRMLIEGMTREVGSPNILIQLWGEAITDPEVKQLASGVIRRIRSLHIGYISLWHQRQHGLSPEQADAVAQEQAPLFVGAAQGFLVQTALMPGFDGDAYLGSLEKYLPR